MLAIATYPFITGNYSWTMTIERSISICLALMFIIYCKIYSVNVYRKVVQQFKRGERATAPPFLSLHVSPHFFRNLLRKMSIIVLAVAVWMAISAVIVGIGDTLRFPGFDRFSLLVTYLPILLSGLSLFIIFSTRIKHLHSDRVYTVWQRLLVIVLFVALVNAFSVQILGKSINWMIQQ